MKLLINKLKLYPFHTFLVVPFIVVFLYSQNLSQVQPQMTYRSLFIGVIVSIVFFSVFYLFFRDRLKTGIYTTLFLFALFQYGVLYDFFSWLYYQGNWPLKNIHRYLVVIYILGLGTFFFFIKKTKHDLIKINYFLNFLFLILLAFNLYKINFTDRKQQFNQGSYQKIETDLTHTDSLPDIYYIILDGYANNSILDKYYNFKNDTFTSYLKKMNFTFCDSAFSNYYSTLPSLAATLNMNYLDNTGLAYDRLCDNLLFKTLKNRYKIYHMQSGFAITSSFVNADSTICIDGPKEFEKSILRHTVLRLGDLMGVFDLQRLNSQFKKMHDLVKIKNTPKFCFLHFVTPHPPYVFDRDGKARANREFTENLWEPKAFYVDQVIYVNGQIAKLVNNILSNSANATIIIQSDHGPWVANKSQDETFEARSKILYAYYSNKNLKIPKTTSSVNTFRYVLNSIFNCNLPILPNNYAGKKDWLADPVFQRKVKKL